MGEIVFEGEPPYEALSAISATSVATRDGILLTFVVRVSGLPSDVVPIQVLLEPAAARALSALQIHADVVERWLES